MSDKFEGLNLNDMSPHEIKILITTNQDLKLEIVKNMQSYGGSFVKSLSECVLRADQNNLWTLVDGFLNYFITYQPCEWDNRPETKKSNDNT